MSSPSQPLLAADRVRLYLTLVPYLLERGQVSLSEASEEFGVTPAEMRSMVERLTVIGLPGDSGFWQQPQEMFDINWDLLDEDDIIEITNDVALRRVPRLTAREAAALLAGLQMVAAVPGATDAGVVEGLISKLSRGAADAPADVVIAASAVDEVRAVVASALQNGVALSFTYQAPDSAPTTRTVDPVQILITNAQWYLQGWCHLRQAMRTFHLDRVSAPALTSIPSVHGHDAVPEAFASTDAESEVTVRISARLAPLLGPVVRIDEPDSGGVVTGRVHLADPRSIKRWAARYGGALEVVDPAVGRMAAREWAAAGLALYRNPDAETGL